MSEIAERLKSDQEFEMLCRREAVKEVEKMLLFAGCKPLAKLSDNDKRAVVDAIKHYTEVGAVVALKMVKEKGCQ